MPVSASEHIEHWRPLRNPVRSGQDNVVKTKPFAVVGVHGLPSKWDPESKPLRLLYSIHNPNGQAVAGRVLYMAPRGSDSKGIPNLNNEPGVVLHKQMLTAEQVRHGMHYLPEPQEWDGVITRGLKDRIGEKVTADLAPIIILLEIWDRPIRDPGMLRDDAQSGRGRGGVHIERGRDQVNLDVFVEARWNKRYVIPYGDPKSPRRGYAHMLIKVRNVREGTPARLIVSRLGNPDDPWGDGTYTITGEEGQPGLEGAIVKDGRIQLPNGKPPFVRFNQYEEHYDYNVANYYGIRVAFGERGGGMAASERDYIEHPRRCLLLKLTVLIHNPARDLPKTSRFAREMGRFFKKTKYWHPIVWTRPARSHKQYLEYFQHRYIVLFLGHSGARCRHDDHPRVSKKPDWYKAMYDRAFPPDGNCCPDKLLPGRKYRRQIRQDRRRGKKEYGGCGNKSHVRHNPVLGKVKRVIDGKKKRVTLDFWNRIPSNGETDAVIHPTKGNQSDWMYLEKKAPRFLFWNGGCRGMLTTNLGECFVHRTAYYHGWVYIAYEAVDIAMVRNTFRYWIRGTRRDPAPSECDEQRFLAAYRRAARRGKANTCHPRIMDQWDGVLPMAQEPDQVEEALQ